MTLLRKILQATGAIALATGLCAAAAGPALALPAVAGAGSSFAGLEIDQWRADVARAPYNLNVNYTALGSGFGREQFISGKVDFGMSDIRIENPQEQARLDATPRKNFVYVPVSAGGLGFIYNLKDAGGNRVKNLRLRPSSVCRIFTEDGIKWNDPEIAADNPGVALPARPIYVATRADSAGETFVFMDFCIANVPQIWSTFISKASSKAQQLTDLFLAGKPSSIYPDVPWVHGFNASDGVADAVVSKDDAIGYAAAGYAKVRDFPNAFVLNAGGQFTDPADPVAVTVALGYATRRDDGTFTLAYNGIDKRAYFPSTYSYAMVQTAGFDPGRGEAVARFLYYCSGLGQKGVEQIGYARLSSELVDLAFSKIEQIPGAPAAASMPKGDPPLAIPPEQGTGTIPSAGGGAAAGGGDSTSSGAGAAGSGDAATGGSTGGAGGSAAGSASAGGAGSVKKTSASAGGGAGGAGGADGTAGQNGFSGSDIAYSLIVGVLVAALATASVGKFGGI